MKIAYYYREKRESIKNYVGDRNSVKNFLVYHIGIDVTRDGFFKVRPDEKTPSCYINKNGSCHDFGSGEHYADIVSLLFDGFHAFDTLPETMKWVCCELGISWEMSHE